MSREVDERVVSMQFDNRHFEANVKTTMSTLDKLKAKLHLPGAAKGLEDVGHAAKKVNLSPIGSAAETVGLKFNAMYTIADQALRNITNSAMAAGKKIVNSLTIDPVKTGFSEYETKINAVQTIMSNTASKGTTMADVTRVLDELNTYADKTIYNFAEMTRNIGTFTAAGVGLEESANAIQGIANLAAASGSTSQQASTAMYQLSQALSAGTVKLMDWNSVVNAGMGGEKFQEALKSTAREMGISVDSMIKKHGSFRESLKEGWITADVLNTTLRKFTKEGAAEYAESMLKSGKYTKEQADALIKEAESMNDAATKVKTFTQLIDTLKESMQSGWSTTWELLIGDFEQAKEMFSAISDVLGGFIDKFSDARNTILKSALGKSFKSLMEPLKDAEKMVKSVSEPIKTVTKSLEDYNSVVKEVIRGDWGTTQKRWDALTKAGYDWATVQNMVNEELGCSVRHNTDYKIGQAEVAKSTEKATESNAKYIASLAKMTDEQLKSSDLNEKQIEAIREIQKQADKLGLSVEDFVTNIDKIDGRWVMLNSFKNIWSGLVKVFKDLGLAWRDVFDSKSTEEKANKLYDIMAGFHKMTVKFNEFADSITTNEEKAGKLRRTFAGLFAILDMVTTITGGAFKMAFKVITGVLGAFNLDILDVTAAIGDVLVKMSNWVDKHNIFTKAAEVLVPIIKKIITVVKEWFSVLSNGHSFGEAFTAGFEAIKDWIKGLKEADNIPKYIIQGLVNGLKFGAQTVFDAIVNIGKKILESIKKVLGIHSPSTEFFEIGKNIIQGLVNGIKTMASIAWDLLKNIGLKCVELVKELDLGTLIAGGIGVGLVAGGVKLLSIVEKFAAPMEGLSDMFEGIGQFFTDFGAGAKSFLKGAGLEMKAKAIQSFAIAIGILAASIYVLSKIPTADLWIAVGAIAVLSVIIGGLAFAISKMGDIKNVGKSALGLLGVAAAMFIMAKVLKELSGIDAEDSQTIVQGLILIVGSLSIVLVLFNQMGKKAGKAGGVGSMLLKFAVALLIMIGVIKLISEMSASDLFKGLVVIAALEYFVGQLVLVSKVAGKHADKAGKMIMRFGIALLIMSAAMKIFATMEVGEIVKGLAVIAVFEMLVYKLVAISSIAGENASKAGSLILKFSAALLIVAGAMLLIGMMDSNDIFKGLVVIGVLEFFMGELIAISRLAGANADKAGKMLFTMSIAIAILVGVIAVIGLLDLSTIGKGLAVITVLELLFGGLIAVTHLAKDSDNMKVMLITMTAAIVALVAAMIGLSFIEPKRLAGAVAALTIVMGAFALIIAATKFAKGIKVSTLVGLISVVTILAGLVALLSFMKADTAIDAAIGLSALITAMTGCLVAISKIKVDAKKTTQAILALTAMVVPLTAFAGALALIGMMNISTDNVGALVAVATAMTLLLIPLNYIGKSAGSAVKGVLALTAMAVPLLAFAGSLAVVGMLDMATENVGMLVGLMTAMTLLLIPLTIIGNFAVQALIGVGVLTLMAVPMLAFVGVLAVMNNVSNAMSNVFLLTALMTTMGDLLFKISLVAPLAVIAVAAITALTLVMGAIGVLAVGIGALMDLCPGLQTFLDTGLDVMIQLAGGIGSMIGALLAAFTESIAGVLPVLAENLSAFAENMAPFINVIQTVDERAALGAGFLAAAIIAITVADLIAGIGKLLTFGSSFTDLAKDLSTFAEELIPFVTVASTIKPEMVEGVGRIADIILTLTGASILDGLASLFGCEGGIEKFATQMPMLGTGLRGFMDNIGTFSDAESSTVTCASKAVKALAEAAEAIPNTGGLLASLVGDNDMDKFAKMFPVLGTGLTEFLANIGTFTDEQIATVNCAAEAIKTLATASKEIPNSGGLLGDLVGNNDMDTFAKMFPALGTGIRDFLTNIGTFTEDEQATVTCAADAVKTLASAAKEIPNTGGLLADLVGDNDLGVFADKLPKVGTGIKGLLTNIGTFSDQEIKTVECAANAIATLAKVAQDIPDTGGFLASLVGDNDLGDFAEKLPQVGTGLRGFADKIGTFSEAQVTSVKLAVDALKAIVQLANLDFDSMEDNFEGFVDIVPQLGSVMPEFAKVMVDATATGVDINVAGLNMIHSAGTKLAQIINALPAEGFANVFAESGMLKTRLTTLVEAFKTLSITGLEISAEGLGNSVSAGETVAALINKMPADFANILKDAATFKGRLGHFADAMKSFMESMSGVDITQLTTLTDNLEPIMENFSKIGQNGFDKFSKSFTDKAPDLNKAINEMLTSASNAMEQHVNKFNKAGGDLGDGLAKGIEDKGDTVNKKAKALGDNAVTYITDKSFYTDFYNAGASVAEGFANGISENAYKAAAKAAAMASAAYEKAKEELDVNSPSKIFRKLGYSVPEGFAMGIDKMGDMVDKSSTSMASSAISSARNAIGRMVDIMNGNIDVQPTIRPVMDLSDVTAGAGVINGMFGRSPSVGLRTNVNSITSMMNNRQNGGNSDVVSAIDSLKDIIGKSSGDVYNFGDLTYDDGSAIADALQTIVRATRIEGRR